MHVASCEPNGHRRDRHGVCVPDDCVLAPAPLPYTTPDVRAMQRCRRPMWLALPPWVLNLQRRPHLVGSGLRSGGGSGGTGTRSPHHHRNDQSAAAASAIEHRLHHHPNFLWHAGERARAQRTGRGVLKGCGRSAESGRAGHATACDRVQRDLGEGAGVCRTQTRTLIPEYQERCAWRRRLAAVAERGIAASSRLARLSPSVRPRPSPTLRTGDRSSGHDAHPICRAFCPPCPRPRSMYDHLRQSRAAWASEACAGDASGRSQEGQTRLHWSPLEPDSWQSVAMRR